MMKYFLLAALLTFSSIAAEQGREPPRETLGGFLRKIFNPAPEPRASAANSPVAGLDAGQLHGGIKQALEQGFQAAINQLGQTNGFLTNLNVRIPLPSQLKPIEQGLRALGQDQLVEQFELTLNRAAEKAVPAATSALLDTLHGLSIQDAASLLTSQSPTAATEYFREQASADLFAKFLPIVKEATSAAGATSAYKQVMDSAPLSRFGFLPDTNLDIDQFVTVKALDGLFLVIGEEEKRIREDPRARGTELLEKVFGILDQPAP